MSYKRDDSETKYGYSSYAYEYDYGYDYGYDKKDTYKKKKSYYYYVESYFKGDKKYEEAFKATCLNSIKSARKIYESPYLTVSLSDSKDAYTNLLTDVITIGKRHIQELEKQLKAYCSENSISFNQKRALIDIFKFVYIHELSHIKYSKRLSTGKDLYTTINEIDDDEFKKLLPDLEETVSAGKLEILKKDLICGLIYKLINILEDYYINLELVNKGYKNQFFDSIRNLILNNLMGDDSDYADIIQACLNEFEKREINGINDLVEALPTQHDFIMFIFNVLVDIEYKIELNSSLIDFLKEVLSELILPSYEKALERAEAAADRYSAAYSYVVGVKKDSISINKLREEIKKYRTKIIRDESGGILR